ILALLAYLSQRRLWALVLTFIWQAFVVLASSVVVLGLHFGLIAAQMESHARQPLRGAWSQLGYVWLWCVAGGLVALVLILPSVRRALARKLPIQPESWVHAFALSFVGGTTVMFLGQLIAAWGRLVMLLF